MAVAAIVLLCAVAFAAARAVFLASPAEMFYQSEFGPAVMLAAGHGFENPRVDAATPLSDFLSLKAQSIESTALADVVAGPPDQFQHRHRYLLTLTGYWWRTTSISWQRLAEVAGLLHAAAVLSTYALLRLFVPAAVALAGGLIFALSPLQLAYAPHLRDFSKGAFVLAAVPLMIVLVERARARRSLVAAAALSGAVVGIGIGFKFDVAIMAPLTIVCVFLFRDRRPWAGLCDKAVITAVMTVALLVTAWPVTSRLSAGGSNAMHVVLLGYSDWFDTRLGLEPAAYTFVPYYSDEYLQGMLRARAWQSTGADAVMPSAAYDAAGLELWRTWLANFPADTVTRLLAAANGVLNLAFGAPPSTNGWTLLAGLFSWLQRWQGWGWLLGVAIVFSAACSGPRRALFSVVVLAALAGYPSLQFDPRHYFHLQAVPIVASFALGWHAFRLLRPRSTDAPPLTPASLPWRPALALTVLLCAAVPGVAAATRAYQSHQLRTALAVAIDLPGSAITPEVVALEPGRWLVRWTEVEGVPVGTTSLRAAYYAAEFRADGDLSAMAVGLRYRDAVAPIPCATTQNLLTGPGVAYFLFPVYSLTGINTFEGLEMGAQMRERLIRIRRLDEWPAFGPLHVRLSADWRQRRLFQRLTVEERLVADDLRADTVTARGRCGSEIGFVDATLDPSMAVNPGTLSARHASVALIATGLEADATADATAPELARFKPVLLDAGDAVVSRISIAQGGVTMGLRTEGGLAARVAVLRPGASVVVVRAPQAGRFSLVIETGAAGWRPGVRFTLDRLAIVASDGSVRSLDKAQ